MIFYWCSGQDDNIGDVILRRRMLRSLQNAGDVRVYVGSASPEFIEGLGLRPRDSVITNYVWFVLTAMVCSVRRNWKFAFNPGEIKCNRRQSLMHAALIPMMLLANIRGRRCIRIGVGVHGHQSRWGLLIKATVDLAKVNIWRDVESRERFRRGTVAPDWAFDEQGMSADSGSKGVARNLLGISVRSDGGDISASWIAAVQKLVATHNLEPVVVVQVRRDADRAYEISRLFDCKIIEWNEQSHVEQEDRLRSVYRECAAVISDRLHVLVMAMTEGSVPIGLMEHPDSKIRQHFDAAGFDRLSWDVRGWTPEQTVNIGAAVIDNRSALMEQLASAQNRVHELDILVRDQ